MLPINHNRVSNGHQCAKINASNEGLGPKIGEGENAFTVHNCDENSTENINTMFEDLTAINDYVHNDMDDCFDSLEKTSTLTRLNIF